MKRVIYMDHHATTPVDPRVVEAMLPYFTEHFGNAASRTHAYGWDAERGVDRAREQIAGLIGAKPREIIFTSGATESNNIAIQGVVEFYKDRGNHIITAVTEHKAVLDTCKVLERAGRAQVTYVPVDQHGNIDPEAIRAALRDETILISLMLANNEIGTILPLAEIGKIAKERSVLFHSDATQGVGKIPVDVSALGIDLLSCTAHKMYGPKGCGALYMRSNGPRVRLAPLIHGGGHERGVRSGTLNVPGIVGFGAAAELCRHEMADEATRLRTLRTQLYDGMMTALEDVSLNGPPLDDRLPGNLNLSFAGVDGESLLMGLEDIAVSSGSACTSTTLEPSYVLKALGLRDDLVHASLRFGIGRFNTAEEVATVVERVAETVCRVRAISPAYAIMKKKQRAATA